MSHTTEEIYQSALAVLEDRDTHRDYLTILSCRRAGEKPKETAGRLLAIYVRYVHGKLSKLAKEAPTIGHARPYREAMELLIPSSTPHAPQPPTLIDA